MSAVTLRSDSAAQVVMDGAAQMSFAHRGGATRLDHLYQKAPLRVMFPGPAPGDYPLAVLVTTSGGLLGGDRLGIDVAVGAAACAVAMPQAAEKIYRSVDANAEVRIDVGLRAETDAWLEWLPQETILFDGARLRRSTWLEVAGGGRALAGEVLVFGRIARGERLTTGLVHDAWTVSRDGRRIWTDVFRLDGDVSRTLAHPAGLAGARAYATAVYIADDAPEMVAPARGVLDITACRAGVTCIGDVLIVRWLGPDAAAVRRSFGSFWAWFRCRVAGVPPVLPRLWHM